MGCERLITTSILHQKAFGSYRNKFYNKEVVIVGAGPTLNYFNPINNAIHIGCNRAFLYDKIKFDYLFALDKGGLNQYLNDFLKYDCIKFIGDQNNGEHYQIPQSLIYQSNIFQYKTTTKLHSHQFALDIDSVPIGNFSSITLQAVQFALFTNPKKIYIVGVDCTISSQGHFTGDKLDTTHRGQDLQNTDRLSRKYWFELKQFAKIYYPKTEIISVNPVGLKGYFKDVYTKEYIESNPELFKNKKNIEII